MDSAEATWTAIAPVLPVRDVARSAEFYGRHLGFRTAHMEADGSYAVIRNGSQALHLTRAASDEALRAARENISLVVTVADLDAAWARFQVSRPPVRARAPEMMPWGLREFHACDLDGCLLRFHAPAGAGAEP